MRIMVGTANLNQSAKSAKTHSTSARLTKALAHKQGEEEPKRESFDLKLALLSAQAKTRRPSLKSNVRRDLLAEAKSAAVNREWKQR